MVVYPKPPVVTRVEWGCPDGDGNPRGTPQYTTVTHLVVHHTATDNEADDWAAVVRAVWNFHVFTRGWSDIGYNYLIDPRGVIYDGRAGGDDVRGAHFVCANEGTMGICLIGLFDSVTPTTAALGSLARLLAWKCRQRGIDPLGASFHGATRLQLNHISGHRDGDHAPPESGACPVGTECPGEMLYRLLPEIRGRVAQLLSE